MKQKPYLLMLFMALFCLSMGAQTYNPQNMGNDVTNTVYVPGQSGYVNQVYDDGYTGYNGEPPYYLVYNKLSKSELYGIDCAGLRALRNAIYAYHGYKFKSKDLQYLFSRFYWYNPRYSNEGTVYKMMNSTEKYNIDLIKKREREVGCR